MNINAHTHSFVRVCVSFFLNASWIISIQVALQFTTGSFFFFFNKTVYLSM